MQQIELIMGEIVAAAAEAVTITITDPRGETREKESPSVNYIYGSGVYVKDMLDVRSRGLRPLEVKFPLVALFTPTVLKVDSSDYAYTTSLNMIIACSSKKDWSNEMRMRTSFDRILLPLYNALLEEIRSDARVLTNYNGVIPHTMSKNFDYGRYGAYDSNGGQVSEPIDAIDIRGLELTITDNNCVRHGIY